MASRGLSGDILFPRNTPGGRWAEFRADGFSCPVTGVVYRGGKDQQGVPLGGLGTGWIGLGLDGTLDYYSTIFNSYLERRYHAAVQASVPGENPDHWIRRKHIPRHRQPFLAMAVGGRVHVLTTRWVTGNNQPAVNELHYWGHYPVVDIEYDLRVCPLEVGLRAWTPFLPGHAEDSNTPGAVFELRIRNHTDTPQAGKLFFSFHGPRPAEVGGVSPYDRRETKGDLSGVLVTTLRRGCEYSYFLGALGGVPVQVGGEICLTAWDDVAPIYQDRVGRREEVSQAMSTAERLVGGQLPEPAETEGGATVSVDFDVDPGEQEVIHFVLAWYAPHWRTQRRPPMPDGGHAYAGQTFWMHSRMIHKYADRFCSALDVAQYLAQNHRDLLDRMLAWQEVIYAEARLPGWLKDALVNVFAILPQVSFWAKNADPNHWWGEEGIFVCAENLTSCPQQACIANDEFGEWPVDIFFPALARNKLRNFKHHQKATGQTPSTLGLGTDPDSHWYDQQLPVDGQVYVHMVDRIWQVTGDDEFLQEYWPSVKAGIDFMKTVDEDGDGLVDVEGSNQYYDTWPTMAGAASHISGYWLATLRIAERMAEHMGDGEFAQDMREWYRRGSQSMEHKLWNEVTQSYLVFHQPETGVKSDSILSDQLIGQYFAERHGLPDLFPDGRTRMVLETIWTHNVRVAKFGVRTAIRPDLSHDGQTFHSGLQTPSYSSMVPSALMISHGTPERGLEIMRSVWHKMVVEGDMAWDQPCMLTPDGEVGFGIEYYHNTMLWTIPMALLGQDLKQFASPGGLAYQVVRAGEGLDSG